MVEVWTFFYTIIRTRYEQRKHSTQECPHKRVAHKCDIYIENIYYFPTNKQKYPKDYVRNNTIVEGHRGI